MATVYVLTTGEYSDYGIVSVHSSKEKAEAHIKAYARSGDTGYSIEEYEVDMPVPVLRYSVEITRGGDTYPHGVSSFTETSRTPAEFRRYTFSTGGLQGSLAVFHVTADDPATAIKVANERRAVIVAGNAWGDEQKTREILGQSA